MMNLEQLDWDELESTDEFIATGHQLGESE